MLLPQQGLAQESAKTDVATAGTENVDYGVVVYSRGKAQLLSSKGEAKEITKGLKFYKGDKIVTYKDSFVIIKTCDNTTSKIDAESEIEIESLMQADKEGYLGFSKFILKAGGIMLDVVKIFEGPPTVQIKTRKGVEMGVRGTLFYVFDETKTGNIWTSVKDGKVWIWDEAQDDYEEVEKDQSLVLLDGQTITRPQKWRWSKKVQWPGENLEASLDPKLMESYGDREKELKNSKDFIRKRKKRSFKQVLQKFGISESTPSSSGRITGPITLGGSSFASSIATSPSETFPALSEKVLETFEPSKSKGDIFGSKSGNGIIGGGIIQSVDTASEDSDVKEDKLETPPPPADDTPPPPPADDTPPPPPADDTPPPPPADDTPPPPPADDTPPPPPADDTPQPVVQETAQEKANKKCAAINEIQGPIEDGFVEAVLKPSCQVGKNPCGVDKIEVCDHTQDGVTWYCCVSGLNESN